jgi:hypothetical protein
MKEVFARRHMHDADDLTPRVAGLSASRPCGFVPSIIRLFHHPNIVDAGVMQGAGTVLDPAVSDWEAGREDSKLLANGSPTLRSRICDIVVSARGRVGS